MKTKKYILTSVLLAMLTFSACELEFQPTGVVKGDQVTSDNFESMVYPLYNLYWCYFNDKFYFGLGDGMSYNLTSIGSTYIVPFSELSVTGVSDGLPDAWNALYIVVQQSNKILKDFNANETVAEAVKRPLIAEARFMRGLAYWHLASLWGSVIISEDPAPLVKNPVVNLNNQKDAYEFALRDMEYAAKYLPETSKATGRVNRYSAFGMLSRMYLAYSGLVASNYGENPNCQKRDAAYLELAKKAAEKVIGNSAYKLLENYSDLFKIDFNNNAESLFAFQWTPGGSDKVGWGVTNTQQHFLACTSEITGGDAWGSQAKVTWNMLNEYEREDTIRRKATWMGYGDFYPELNSTNGGFTYTLNKVDSEEASSMLNVKKGVTGSSKDNPAIGTQNSGLDNYMLRLAEVYLNYAEAILGNESSTSNATALQYFNAVRTRAGLTPKASITWQDLRHERRVEFCMEGRYWYDLLSRAYYRQQEVINIIADQDRGNVPSILFTAPNDWRINPKGNGQTVVVGTPNPGTFILPYPSDEKIKNPKMSLPPVPYTFTEERITDLFN